MKSVPFDEAKLHVNIKELRTIVLNEWNKRTQSREAIEINIYIYIYVQRGMKSDLV